MQRYDVCAKTIQKQKYNLPKCITQLTQLSNILQLMSFSSFLRYFQIILLYRVISLKI